MASKAATPESYSGFRDIEASIKSERSRKADQAGPNRGRIRDSFNAQRTPAVLIIGVVVTIGVLIMAAAFFVKILPQFNQQPAKLESQESVNIDELIEAGKLERARVLLEKSVKAGKWTLKDSERHIKIAEKYAASDLPEYDSAIEILTKIPKRAPLYRKAQRLAKNYTSLKRRANYR
jgi:hypothetical protein